MWSQAGNVWEALAMVGGNVFTYSSLGVPSINV
jgi:hypothetical protein